MNHSLRPTDQYQMLKTLFILAGKSSFISLHWSLCIRVCITLSDSLKIYMDLKIRKPRLNS